MRPLMSAFLPAPSTMVVLSLSILTRLAWPRSLRVTFSSLMPRSSLIDLTAGQHRDVLQHLLAAIAEARRLDGGGVERAAQLVDDERRERFALDVLGDDEERLAERAMASSTGSRSFMFEIFFSEIRM